MVHFRNRNSRNSILILQCNFDISFRMAYLLQPECNFLHGYFRCHLSVEVVDMGGKITSMQGTHIFRRNMTTQLIKCTLWSARLCPPTIIKKMRTFLEVKGKLGPIPQSSNQYRPPQPDTNPNIRKDTKHYRKEKESGALQKV